VPPAGKRPFVRRLVVTAIAVLFLLPVVLPGAVGSMATMSTSPTDWVPPTLEERRLYDWFVENFEREAAIIISWPGCRLADPRLARFESALGAAAVSSDSPGDARLLERVISGRSVLAELTAEPPALSREQAVERMRGFLVGRDGETTCAVVVLTDEGARQKTRAIEAVRLAGQEAGVPRDEQRLSGAPVESVLIDEESSRTLYQFAIPSALVSLALCWFCLRSWRYTLAIVIAAGLGEAVTLAMVYYTGTPMNALLIVMPPLIFVLTVSAGIHLTNYYYEAARHGDLQGAIGRAITVGWLPCLLALATTVIGIGSLVVSSVLPIRQFGIFAPLGLTATVGLLFLVLPGTIEWLPQAPRSAEQAGSARQRRRQVGRDAAWWDRLWRLVTRRANWIAAGCLVLMLAAGFGLPRLKTSVDVRALFSPASRFMRDYTWLDENVAPLIPVEVLVRIDDDAQLDTVERLELVRDTAQAVKRIERVEGVMSAVVYAPPLPSRSFTQVVKRRRMNNELSEKLNRFVDARFLHLEPGGQTWRISVRLRPDEEADYAGYLSELRKHVDPVLARYNLRDGVEGRVRVEYTGAMPLTDRVHRMLLRDLYVSFLTASLLVAVVMILMMRGIGAGLLAMVPNLFPMVLLFGCMGLLEMPVDIGSLMTASIALGIAVDDTLHFLTWYRREIDRGAAPVEAVRRTYRHCGRAMVQTTLVCGLGLSVFVFSGFLPTQRFCGMILVLLLLGLLGDLVLLPALLVGPLGRFVRLIGKAK
jgi:predicted RND superfamily exporter protein